MEHETGLAGSRTVSIVSIYSIQIIINIFHSKKHWETVRNRLKGLTTRSSIIANNWARLGTTRLHVRLCTVPYIFTEIHGHERVVQTRTCLNLTVSLDSKLYLYCTHSSTDQESITCHTKINFYFVLFYQLVWRLLHFLCGCRWTHPKTRCWQGMCFFTICSYLACDCCFVVKWGKCVRNWQLQQLMQKSVKPVFFFYCRFHL